jgi:hypothetical protein
MGGISVSIKIEIVGDSNEELVSNLVRFAAGFGLILSNGVAPAVGSESEEKKSRGRPKKVAAPETAVVAAVAVELSEEAPKAVEEPVKPAPTPVINSAVATKEEMETALKTLCTQEKGLEKAKAILEKYGYKLVRDVKEEHYGEICSACKIA